MTTRSTPGRSRAEARRIVFGACHKATGTRVAFKKLHSRNLDDVARMRREVEAAQLFGGHPHVVPVLDVSPTYEWLVMPLAADTAQTGRQTAQRAGASRSGQRGL